MNEKILFDFNKTADISNWKTVDDTVMGGRSNGNFKINKDGHGLFSGSVSLENNGGFSSVRYYFPTFDIGNSTNLKLRLKGDGKSYQARLKHLISDRHSYVQTFRTSGNWEVIDLTLIDFYPTFRGQDLPMDNYKSHSIEEFRFLIGNKKSQDFKLLIDWIKFV